MILKHAAPALLGLSLISTSAQALDLNALSDAEKAEFGAQVREYLLENPEVIIEAITILEQRNAASQEQADRDLVASNADELFNDGYSWVGGNPDGDITLVEFIAAVPCPR